MELILISERSLHPMHIHGYSFRVVGFGAIPEGATVADLIEMDKQGKLFIRAAFFRR